MIIKFDDLIHIQITSVEAPVARHTLWVCVRHACSLNVGWTDQNEQLTGIKLSGPSWKVTLDLAKSDVLSMGSVSDPKELDLILAESATTEFELGGESFVFSTDFATLFSPTVGWVSLFCWIGFVIGVKLELTKWRASVPPLSVYTNPSSESPTRESK